MKRVSRGTTKSSQTVSRPPLLIMLTRMQFCGRQNTALRPWRTKDDHSRGHATYVIFYRTRVRDWCHLTLFCIVSHALHKYDYDQRWWWWRYSGCVVVAIIFLSPTQWHTTHNANEQQENSEYAHLHLGASGPVAALHQGSPAHALAPPCLLLCFASVVV